MGKLLVLEMRWTSAEACLRLDSVEISVGSFGDGDRGQPPGGRTLDQGPGLAVEPRSVAGADEELVRFGVGDGAALVRADGVEGHEGTGGRLDDHGRITALR